MKDIGPIDPQEIKVITFPFASELGDTATIATAEVTATLVRGGADTTPQQMVVGAALIAGADVKQRIQGRPYPDSTYRLKAKVTDSDGLVHIIKVNVLVKE